MKVKELTTVATRQPERCSRVCLGRRTTDGRRLAFFWGCSMLVWTRLEAPRNHRTRPTMISPLVALILLDKHLTESVRHCHFSGDSHESMRLVRAFYERGGDGGGAWWLTGAQGWPARERREEEGGRSAGRSRNRRGVLGCCRIR
jgi:hypothetical protein